MKRRRKCWYTLRARGLYWGGKKLGWVSEDDIETTQYTILSSSRTIMTVKKAARIALSLGRDTTVTRWSYKKGIRYSQDFVVN